MKEPTSNSNRTNFFILLVFIAFALITHRDVLRGKVPFAREEITAFPPWAGSGYAGTRPHAEVGDSVTLFYPWRVFQRTALQNREFPLWNPYILGGTPFLAEPQSALFYPVHLLLPFMSPPVFWAFKLLLDLVLSGFFTALFLRSIGGSRSGAVAAGLLFSCCGFMAAWQTFSALADVAIWLPFILWTVHRLCSRPSIGRMVLTALALAMPVLAGHPETALHVTLLVTGFALWQSIATGTKTGSVGRLLLWFTAGGFISLGLTAVQWIPMLEWLPLVPHSLGIHWPPLPTRWILAFFSRDLLADPNSAGVLIPEGAAYVAPMALLLAPVAILRRDRREAWFFAAAALLALFEIYGWWPVHSIVSRIPVLEGVKNWRTLLLVDFSLAVLAGLGITMLETEPAAKTGSRRWIAGVTGFSLALSLAGIWVLAAGTAQAVSHRRGPEWTAVFLMLGAAAVLLRVTGHVRAATFSLVALVILCLDLGTFRSGILPFVPPREIFPQAPTFDFLKMHADPGQYRVAAIYGAYPPNAEMVYGLAALTGYDLTLTRLKNVLDDFGPAALDTVGMNAEPVANLNDRRLDLLNVRYVVATTYRNSSAILAAKPERFKAVFSDGTVTVFENLHALPRSLFVPAAGNSIEVVPDEQQQVLRLKSPLFDPEKSVILSGIPPGLESAPTNSGMDSQHANSSSVLSVQLNGVDLAVRNAQPGVLVVSQIYYPGWTAFVDGKETPAVPADYALIGVPLAPGAHSVRLEFRPRSFRIGLVVSAFSVLLIASLLAVDGFI